MNDPRHSKWMGFNLDARLLRVGDNVVTRLNPEESDVVRVITKIREGCGSGLEIFVTPKITRCDGLFKDEPLIESADSIWFWPAPVDDIAICKFKIGDMVTTDLYPPEKHVVRTVTGIIESPHRNGCFEISVVPEIVGNFESEHTGLFWPGIVKNIMFYSDRFEHVSVRKKEEVKRKNLKRADFLEEEFKGAKFKQSKEMRWRSTVEHTLRALITVSEIHDQLGIRNSAASMVDSEIEYIKRKLKEVDEYNAMRSVVG